ncbi:MAG: ABC transporter permease [Thermoanaerobaculia bacterium]
MNSPSDTSSQDSLDSQLVAPAPMSETRPMYWSVRRELWENRSIYLAPLIVAAVVLFAALLGTIGLPKRMRAASAFNPAKRSAAIVKPYSMAPAPIMLATFLVGFFYSLDALYGERRDRSILFWKSLPVSDRTTVLSKASIPLVVLPLIAFVLSVVTQVIMLMFSTAVLVGSGLSPVRLWAEVRFFEGLLIMPYGLAAHALWFAPIYGWLLLVSAWARRAPVLWAVVPLLAISAVERIAFSSSHFCDLLKYRVIGAMTAAFTVSDGNIDRLSKLDPAKFLSTPGLWVGLLFAAAFLVAAVRLRRNWEPI